MTNTIAHVSLALFAITALTLWLYGQVALANGVGVAALVSFVAAAR